jgi:hypothetical protein
LLLLIENLVCGGAGLQGLQNSFQLLYMLCAGQRDTLTLCAASADKKRELLQLLKSLIADTTKVALPDPKAFEEYHSGAKTLVEGYLAKQGTVLFKWYRYYVRFTGDKLFYFHSHVWRCTIAW